MPPFPSGPQRGLRPQPNVDFAEKSTLGYVPHRINRNAVSALPPDAHRLANPPEIENNSHHIKMAYTLQSFIGAKSTFDAPAIDLNLKTITLPQNFAMIPLTRDILKKFNISSLPLTDDDDGAKSLPTEITELATKLCPTGKLAYVEAEFFGGAGTQACVTWDNANQSPPIIHQTAINTALQFLGVKRENLHDEFEALDLGRHRSTEAWLPSN
jgi:hypothetical protein